MAYDGDRLVGSARIVSDGILHAMIYDMIIDPDYQRKGIGTKILNLIIEKCIENNIGDIQLFCAQGKKEFYLKNGFEIRDEDAPGMQYNRKRLL
jgi:GNAT superfamily N-acetyltransferase